MRIRSTFRFCKSLSCVSKRLKGLIFPHLEHTSSYFFLPGRIIVLFIFLVSFISCEKDVPLKSFNVREGIFILNEGNFTYGNSSLSFYDSKTKELLNNVFENTNGFPIGDVLQSMTLMDSMAFLVVNNSGKIMVMNANSFKYTGILPGFVSPRQMLIINNSKAYVSDLYNNSISIINPVTYTKTGNIGLKKGSESMLKYGNYVFVGNWSKQKTIQRINISEDKLIDSLVVTKQPNSMVLDKNNKLWVLSDGGLASLPGGKVKACLTRINPESFTIEKEFVFPDLNSAPSRLFLNTVKDTLYFLNGSWGTSINKGGVYRMSINDLEIPSTAFIPENGRLFYALGVDPKNTDIYVSDAIDYLQAGWVFRYNNCAVLIDSFKTDIIPSGFCFKYDKF